MRRRVQDAWGKCGWTFGITAFEPLPCPAPERRGHITIRNSTDQHDFFGCVSKVLPNTNGSIIRNEARLPRTELPVLRRIAVFALKSAVGSPRLFIEVELLHL